MKLQRWHWILLVAAAIAGGLAPFACPWPDGLEHVAETFGFAHRGEGPPLVSAPVADYALPGIRNGRLASALAGLLGVAVMLAVTWGLARLLARREVADDR